MNMAPHQIRKMTEEINWVLHTKFSRLRLRHEHAMTIAGYSAYLGRRMGVTTHLTFAIDAHVTNTTTKGAAIPPT